MKEYFFIFFAFMARYVKGIALFVGLSFVFAVRLVVFTFVATPYYLLTHRELKFLLKVGKYDCLLFYMINHEDNITDL